MAKSASEDLEFISVDVDEEQNLMTTHGAAGTTYESDPADTALSYSWLTRHSKVSLLSYLSDESKKCIVM